MSQFQCATCPAGTFSNVSGATACLVCEYGKYSSDVRGAATACLPRTTLCSEGHYVLVQNHIPSIDNACVECLPCQRDTYSVSILTGEVGGSLECPGDSTYPGYTCRRDVPMAGYFYVSGKSFASSSQNGGTTSTTTESRPCTDLLPEDLRLLSYVAGPVYGCFVGCRYGMVLGGDEKYIARFGKFLLFFAFFSLMLVVNTQFFWGGVGGRIYGKQQRRHIPKCVLSQTREYRGRGVLAVSSRGLPLWKIPACHERGGLMRATLRPTWTLVYRSRRLHRNLRWYTHRSRNLWSCLWYKLRVSMVSLSPLLMLYLLVESAIIIITITIIIIIRTNAYAAVIGPAYRRGT